MTRSFSLHKKHQQTQRLWNRWKGIYIPDVNLAVFIAAKLLGNKILKISELCMGPPYWCYVPLWYTNMAAKPVCEKKEKFCSKVIRCTSECFSYHFKLISISEKYFKSTEILVSVTFQITLSKAVSNFKTLYLQNKTLFCMAQKFSQQ